MIQEYALDPSVLVAEYPRQYGFLRDAFNDTGRVLSQYPRKWKQKVMQLLGGASDKDRMKLEALLKDWLLRHSVKREHSIFNGGDWLQEAEDEDARIQFHGILTSDNPRNHKRVIPFDHIVAGDDPRWNCKRTCRVTRTAQDIVTAIAPLLMRSKRIVLIDPYFLMEPRFYNVLTEIINVLTSADCVHSVAEIQICTALKGRWAKGTLPEPAEQQRLASYFQRECVDQIPHLVPSGFRVNFTVYFEKEHGIDAHDRHILTDIAGVDFGQGLDQRRDRNDDNHVRINLLDYEECCRLEDDFQPHMSGASASYHIESEFTSVGSV
ncbi:hypothetical protein DSECCO2_335070 [anaerobic digester metagenome]